MNHSDLKLNMDLPSQYVYLTSEQQQSLDQTWPYQQKETNKQKLYDTVSSSNYIALDGKNNGK
jgi:hypothetical protein